VVIASLIHAYKIQPYKSTLRTKALVNINFTLILVIPITLQLVQTDIKLRYAAFSLAFKI
jgi:hypothetical protein